MTTITTGTTGPRAWKIALVAAAVGAAALAVANVPQLTSDTGQPVAQTATATLPESVTGFEYGNESTSGRATSPGVTAQYLGNSGELFPYENGAAPSSASEQATIDGLVPSITQEFLDGPGSSATQGSTRADPRAAVALAASDEALVNPAPEVDAAQMIEGLIAAEIAAGVPTDPVGVDVTATNARWEALAAAYSEANNNGSFSSLYRGDPDPADQKFIEGQPKAVPVSEPHVPMTNNQLR